MSKVVYEAPWICYLHNFFTKNKVEFMQHMHDVPHTAQGNNAPCERCGKKIRQWKVPYFGINEPIIILCKACQAIPNVIEFIRAKRRSEFPPSKAVSV